jgi:hypothetical protein
MSDWNKVNRSGRISAFAAAPAAAIAWYVSRRFLSTHPSGAWFSGLETTYEPIFWAFLAAAVTFIVSFIICSIAQMPPDPPV